MSFGRTRSILFPHTVPLPARQPGKASLDAFVSLCELATIVDKLQLDRRVDIGTLTDAASSLERWKTSVDVRGTLAMRDGNGDPPAGIRSLHLLYLGSNLIIVREAWNLAGTDPAIQASCQQTCLKACTDIVDFVISLSLGELAGYWSSGKSRSITLIIACPFILSFCLTLLIRLIVAADRQDQSDTSIWQIALFNLRK